MKYDIYSCGGCKVLCVCVCVRERERERWEVVTERDSLDKYTYITM